MTLASCATAVKFDVERPPLVDLRNVSSITVIPFEWSSSRDYEPFAKLATSSLMNGLRTGIINTVDPYTLEDVSTLDYYRYVDVYITGRITDVELYGATDILDEPIGTTMTRRTTFYSGYASIEIEYRYVRAIDNRVLGTFRKRESNSETFERVTQFVNQDIYWNQTGRPPGRGNNPQRNMNRSGQRSERSLYASLHREPWLLPIAETAIVKFTHAMTDEVGPWITTEKRTIRKGRSGNSQAAQARKLVKQGRFYEALGLYTAVYEQDGSTFAGYNTGVLLAADERFTEALALLESLYNRSREQGRRIPSYLERELRKMTELVNGLRMLEEYRGNRPGAVQAHNAGGVSITRPPDRFVPQPHAAETTHGEITGTVNIYPALIYALSESISSLDDDSVFAKMIANTSTDSGRWSMAIPVSSPASFWLVVTDGYNNNYITETAVSVSSAIVLDTAAMIKLE